MNHNAKTAEQFCIIHPVTDRKFSVLPNAVMLTGEKTHLLRKLSNPLACTAEQNFQIIPTETENTAPIVVIFLIATKENMRMKQNELMYQVTMSIFRNMVRKGLLTKEEYAVIDTKMQEKYQPKFGTLFVDLFENKR